MKYKIFVSYSTHDIDQVELLRRQLNGTPIDVFVAEHSVKPSEDLGEKISQAIEECDLFVVLWSKNAQHEKWGQMKHSPHHHPKSTHLSRLRQKVSSDPTYSTYLTLHILEIRQWCLHKRSDLSIKEFANKLNPVVRGWIEYYGAFFQSELLFLVRHLDKLLYRWVIRKYRKQGSNFKKVENWVNRIKSAMPNYFVHWGLLRA